MNTQIWIVAGLMMSLAVAAKTTPAKSMSRHSPSSPPSSPPSKSWFREKYLVGTYDTYYDYTLHRFEFSDNDHDMCPDVYKSATIFAMTGRYMNRIKQTCTYIYATKPTKNNYPHIDYIPPPSYDLRFIHITVTDVLHFVGQFLCYTFEIGMIILSIVLASCSTLFMIILLFCQY